MLLPPWGNMLIEMLKATSVVSLITISDLTFEAYQLNGLTFRTIGDLPAGPPHLFRDRAQSSPSAHRALEAARQARPRAGAI